jgi:hypothetical protein
MTFQALGTPHRARADSFFVDAATGVGVGKAELDATTELIRQSVTSMPGHKITSKASEADFVLQPKIVKLGSSLIVTLEKLSSGSLISSNRLKATTTEELDTVATRLTRSAIDSTPVESDARVTDVTQSEATRGNQKRTARAGYMVGLGPSGLFNLQSDGIAYGVSGAYAWDMNDSLLKLYSDISAREKAGFIVLGLGGNYFLSDKNTAPFLSAGVGYGSAWLEGAGILPETKGGFALSAGGGVMFLRTSSVNIEMGLNYQILLASTAAGTPMALGLRLSLFFPN